MAINFGLLRQNDVVGGALNSFQAGQTLAKQQAVQNALASADLSTPDSIAATQNALIRAGAPEQAAALESYRQRADNNAFAQSQAAMLRARLAGQPAAAAPPVANALAAPPPADVASQATAGGAASGVPPTNLPPDPDAPPAPLSGPNPRAALLRDPNELHALLSTVAGEARGEPPEGQAAVASVILNRALASGRPISAVVGSQANAQFNGAGYNLDPNSALYATINKNVLPAVIGQDPTNGADHFFNPSLANPSWGRGPGQMIGRHKFVALGDQGGGSVSAVDPSGVQVATNGPLPAGAAGQAPDPTSPPAAAPGHAASMFSVGARPTPAGYTTEDVQALAAQAHTPEQWAVVQKALDGVQEQHVAAYEQTSAAAIGAVRALRGIGDDSNSADLAKRKGAAVAYATRLGMDPSSIQAAPLEQFTDTALNGLENQLQAQRGYKGLDSFSTQLSQEAKDAADAAKTTETNRHNRATEGIGQAGVNIRRGQLAVAQGGLKARNRAIDARIKGVGGYATPVIVPSLGAKLPSGWGDMGNADDE